MWPSSSPYSESCTEPEPEPGSPSPTPDPQAGLGLARPRAVGGQGHAAGESGGGGGGGWEPAVNRVRREVLALRGEVRGVGAQLGEMRTQLSRVLAALGEGCVRGGTDSFAAAAAGEAGEGAGRCTSYLY